MRMVNGGMWWKIDLVDSLAQTLELICFVLFVLPRSVSRWQSSS